MRTRLFVSDIDGCLAEPYRPYDLVGLQRLARLIRQEGAPAFGLCSGRAYAYVEAVSQALGLRAPCIFESGGGLFDPVAATVAWNPAFTPELAAELEEVKAWLLRTCVADGGVMYDYGKRTQVGVIGADAAVVQRYVPEVEAYVADAHPGLRTFHTPLSIDVVARGITKRQAMAWLARTAGLDPEAIAYIGDSNGDLEALQAVGRSFAPANASADVQEAVDVVTTGAVLAGVLQAFEACIEDGLSA